MRYSFVCLRSFCFPGGRVGRRVTPISPAEAAKKINEKVVVEMDVKSTGVHGNHYLN